MTKLDFTFANKTGAPSRGVRVMFRESRANILSYAVSHFPRGITLEQADVTPRGVDLSWSPAITEHAEVVLTMEVRGGPLEIEFEMWRDADGDLTPLPDGYSVTQAVLYQAYTVWELVSRDQLIESLRAAIVAAVPQSPVKAAQFFCDLDLHSNQELMRYTGEGGEVIRRRIDLLRGIVMCLRERVLQRLDWAMTHPGTPAEGLDTWPNRTQLEEISELQLEIYDRYFRKGEGMDLDAVWEAFMLFANGDLQLNDKLWEHWDAGPQGAFLFLFAEFAFLACDAGVDADRWEELLAPLVAVQRIYMQAYRPNVLAKGSLAFEDYKPETWKPDNRVDESTRKALRARFEGYTPARLRIEAGRNALDAFPDSARVP